MRYYAMFKLSLESDMVWKTELSFETPVDARRYCEGMGVYFLCLSAYEDSIPFLNLGDYHGNIYD